MAFLLKDVTSNFNNTVYGKAGEKVQVLDKSKGNMWIVIGESGKFFAHMDAVSEEEEAPEIEEKPEPEVIPKEKSTREKKTKLPPPNQSSLF